MLFVGGAGHPAAIRKTVADLLLIFISNPIA
jgi:hypothetical protein